MIPFPIYSPKGYVKSSDGQIMQKRFKSNRDIIGGIKLYAEISPYSLFPSYENTSLT